MAWAAGFGGGEATTVLSRGKEEKGEKDASEEAGAFVAVDERVIADDAGDEGGGHVDDVGISAIRVLLVRAATAEAECKGGWLPRKKTKRPGEKPGL
jgi:hypothetical protein